MKIQNTENSEKENSTKMKHGYKDVNKQEPSKGVLRKSCSENIKQNYRRTPMPTFDFDKVALQLY